MNRKSKTVTPVPTDYNRDQVGARLWPVHAKWRGFLGLDEYDDTSYLSTDDNGGTYGECELISWEYRTIRIKYYPLVGTLDDDRLEWVVVHEMLHVLTVPNRKMLEGMADKFDDDDEGTQQALLDALRLIDERVTSDLTHAILRVARAHEPLGRTISGALEVVK